MRNPSLLIGIAIGAWLVLYNQEAADWFVKLFALADAWLESNFNVNIIDTTTTN